MHSSMAELEKLIQEKVDAGLFASFEDAVNSIARWLNDIERGYVEEQMRSEDA